MENEPNRNHAAVPADGRVPATQPAQPVQPAPPALDANGFNPDDFDWRPVPRRPRKGGWTPDIQQQFIEALARTGVVEHACREVNMSVASAYTLRHAPGGEGFARAWAAVLARAADRVLDIAFEQAIVGEEIPVHDADGVRVGSKWRYNTRMAMFLLRAYHPERFRHANKDTRPADEAPPPPATPVTQAISSLAPVTPAEPHLLSSPATLDAAVARANYDADKAEAAPTDDSYRPRRVPDTHPSVRQRSRRNKERRERRAEREDVRYGFDPSGDDLSPPDEPAKPTPPVPGDPANRWPPDMTYWLAERAEAEGNIPPALAARRPREKKRASLNFPSTSK